MISRISLARRRRLGLRQLRRWFYPAEFVTAKAIGKYGTTRCPCSSYCCGNPRKWFKKKTLQERRAAQSEKDFEETEKSP